MVFLIALESEKRDPRRNDVERTIQTLGSWCHPIPSVWLISSPLICAEAIKDEIAPHLNASDRLMVLPLHPDAQLESEMWCMPEVPGWFYLNN